MGGKIALEGRRRFIKIGTLGAAGLTFPFSKSLAMIGEKEALNIGVIGTGDRGMGMIHLMNEIPFLKVIGCSDIIPFRLEKAIELSGAKGYEDYRALLDNKKIDAVIIATPFGMHGTMAVDALQAGKHVYCEKTMTRGMEDIQTVLDTHKNSGLVFQTGHQYNSSELYQKIHNIIESGYLGGITAFECQWNRNGDWRRKVPDPKWERMINWRMYREYSGGLVAELCAHQIDFIGRVIGENPEKVSGFGGIDHWKDGRETFDNIHMLFKYPSGVDASFTSTTTNGFEGYQIKVLGEKGTIVMGANEAKIYLERNQLKEYGIVDGVSGATKMAWEQGIGADITASSEDITAQALVQFYHSVIDGKPVYADIKSGALTSQCVQMSLDALDNEKVVSWEDYPKLDFF
jgi:predicted dehydrogenase